jgi:NhaA family Na+:H+ antiporter
MIGHVEEVLERARSPLHKMEHGLAPWTAFVIMPVFAFFNAGVAVGGAGAALLGPVSLGAFLGLLLGKPIGIAGFVALAVKTRLTRLPDGTSWLSLIGVGLIAGIGFTMSLFIASLAFPDPAMLNQAKMGVLCASVIAALAGLAFLHRALPRARTGGVRTSRADAT